MRIWIGWSLLVVIAGAAGCGDKLMGMPDAPPVPDVDAAPPLSIAGCESWGASGVGQVSSADGMSSQWPQLAWLGDGYGVAWLDQRGNDAYYRRIDAAGAPASDEVSLTPNSLVWNGASVAWSGTELVAAWDEFRDGSFEIIANRYDRDGHALGAEVIVSGTSASSQRASIAKSGDGYAVAWVEIREGPQENEEIMLARLGPTGERVGDPVWLTDAPLGSYAPAVATGDGDARVAWHDGRSGTVDVWTAAAMPGAPEPRSTGMPGLVPRLAWSGSEWGVVYHSSRGPNWTMHFARVDGAGQMLAETQLSSGDYYATFGTTVWAGDAWVVAWQENTGADAARILALRIGADGIAIGEPVVVVDTYGVGYASLAVSATDIGVAWQTAAVGAEIWFARLVCSD